LAQKNSSIWEFPYSKKIPWVRRIPLVPDFNNNGPFNLRGIGPKRGGYW